MTDNSVHSTYWFLKQRQLWWTEGKKKRARKNQQNQNTLQGKRAVETNLWIWRRKNIWRRKEISFPRRIREKHRLWPLLDKENVNRTAGRYKKQVNRAKAHSSLYQKNADEGTKLYEISQALAWRPPENRLLRTKFQLFWALECYWC